LKPYNSPTEILYLFIRIDYLLKNPPQNKSPKIIAVEIKVI